MSLARPYSRAELADATIVRLSFLHEGAPYWIRPGVRSRAPLDPSVGTTWMCDGRSSVIPSPFSM